MALPGNRAVGRSRSPRLPGNSNDRATLFGAQAIRAGQAPQHRQAQAGWNSLTPTETKIAAMVAEGMSNRQIAEQLVLSPRTVGTHVSHILAKLGVRSRIDIAREAAEHVKAAG